MTSPAPVLGSSTNVPFQILRGLGFLVLLLMIVSCIYAAFIIIQNWSDISV